MIEVTVRYICDRCKWFKDEKMENKIRIEPGQPVSITAGVLEMVSAGGRKYWLCPMCVGHCNEWINAG